MIREFVCKLHVHLSGTDAFDYHDVETSLKEKLEHDGILQATGHDYTCVEWNFVEFTPQEKFVLNVAAQLCEAIDKPVSYRRNGNGAWLLEIQHLGKDATEVIIVEVDTSTGIYSLKVRGEDVACVEDLVEMLEYSKDGD